MHLAAEADSTVTKVVTIRAATNTPSRRISVSSSFSYDDKTESSLAWHTRDSRSIL